MSATKLRDFFKSKVAFLPFLHNRMKGIKDGTVLTQKGKHFAYSSYHRLVTLRNYLQNYETVVGIIYANDMDDAWFEAFLNYLLPNLLKNSIAGLLSHLRSLLRKCCKAHKISFDAEGFHYGEELTSQVYNSVAELDALLVLDLSNNRSLERVRDAYIIQAYTGLRHSDLAALLDNPALALHIANERRYFKIHTQKTETTVVIPISSRILAILERRNWQFNRISIQLYNKFIKVVGEIAGITQPFERYYTKNGKLVRELHPKNTLMCSHTARRSFATNAFLAGISTLKIRKITGHTTEQSFLRYIRADGMDSALTLIDEPFFQ